jgi:hypothetical protein
MTIEAARADAFQFDSVAQHSGLRIGAVSLMIEAEQIEDVALATTLEPFRDEITIPDIKLRVCRSERLDQPTQSAVFDSGSVWRLFEDCGSFHFDFQSSVFGELPYKRLVIDQRFCSAHLFLNQQCLDRMGSFAPLDYPLDELLIMHRLTQEKAIELHGAGIVRSDGVGNLFVGHSGAGKSTTTRLWTECEEVEVLSDDRIIVRRDEGTTPDRRTDTSAEDVGILRLHERSASPITHSAQNDKKRKIRMYGTPWHGEAMYASPNSAPLARIFVLEHGYGNVLTPLSPSQAVAELFARSFVPFHKHEYVESALEFLQELVDAVPVYRYAFEPDQRAVKKILNLHD